MSITRAQIATQLLNEMAPKGERLAYINNREAELLKRMGGAGKNINETGIKSYYYDEVGQTMGGTGFQDTSSLTGGSGDGNNQPPIQIINQAAIDNYKYGPEFYERPLTKSIAGFAFPMGTVAAAAGKYGVNKLIDNYYDAQEKIAEDVTTARNTGFGQAIGSQYFGPVNNAMMQSYKNIVGGFPTPEPTINTGGGDNIIPRLPMIAETPSDVESQSSDFDLYAALEGRQGMRFGENPYAIKGATQRFSDGGLASLRQNYKLGKLVKKTTDAIKKVVKSDVGKAALVAAGTYALGGGRSPFSKDGMGGFALKNIPGYTATKDFIGNNSMMKDINKLPGYVKYGIPAVSIGSYFASKKANEDENTLDDEIAQKYRDTSGLREQLATYKPFRFQVPKEYQLPYAADGGRIGYQNAGSVNSNDQDLFERFIKEREKYFKNQDKENLLKDFEQFKRNEEPTMAAQGGRIGYEIGGDIDPADLPMSKEGFPRYEDESGEEVPYPYDNQEMASDPDPMAELFQMYQEAIRSGQIPRSTTFDEYKELRDEMSFEYRNKPYGPFLKEETRAMANEGGLMNLGGNEMDLRGGGFVPIGVKEKADDVPARLSKNEFVFTADAVRAAGGGDVDTGADLMYKTMKNLESRVG